MERIKPLVAATRRAGSAAEIGGFGGIFDPRAAGFQDPVLVAATDGVGTKLKIATECGRNETVGIDLVAMCVNDLVVHGAEPLFFLDYFASGKLDESTAEAVIAGVAAGCREAGCALIGGETAEMPGMYGPGDYDLAGFSVGAAERDSLLTGAGIGPGDLLLGLASTGPHANGYSLIRRLVTDLGLDYGAPAPFEPEVTLGAALLRPTRIYVKSCLAATRAGLLKGLAHITGGGFPENLPRVLPDDVDAELDLGVWTRPAVFDWLARAGGITTDEMARTFNCGIGMVAVVDADQAEAAESLLRDQGETVYRIGRLAAGQGRVRLHGADAA